MSEREKTYVEDVNRSIYDIRNEEKDVYRIKKGLTPDIVAEISEKKKDPAWMANFRLQSLQIYNEMEVPDWGPSIEGLNMEDIVTYVKPNTHMSAKWSEVPEDIKDTFEKLGIPQAERKSLAGVGAQYDSELVYHNVREEVAAQGVVYTDMESALTGEYADMLCRMNELSGEKAAVDIASGISADTGAILGTAFRADLTITFAFAKLGSILWPGNEYAGRIIVCDIGITKESWLGEPPAVMALEEKDFSILPKRKSHSNKGSYGKLLLIAGSVNMAGAAVLSAKAAYATGCGLVRVLTPGENRTILQCSVPEAVLTTYDKTLVPEEPVLREILDWADAIVIGPGLGKEKTSAQILNFVLEYGT